MKIVMSYCPATGWFIRPNGKRAGKLCRNGYRRIFYQGKAQMEHRLAYRLMHGFLGKSAHVDHINGVRDDNRISNLMACTKSTNVQLGTNALFCSNTSGYTGVHFHKVTKHFYASIWQNNKRIWRKSFKTAEAAVQARKAEMQRLGIVSRRP